jgi:hypothetical protein
MFKFLKRSVVPDVPPAPPRKPAKKSIVVDVRLHHPAPLPEVTEGNEQSDWALWEDSVVALDSQMQSLGPLSRFTDRTDTSSDFQDIDAYARVKRRDA